MEQTFRGSGNRREPFAALADAYSDFVQSTRISSNMLLEQFGGANGELTAAMQYSVQGLNCEDAARKDLLMDIGTEELSHLEIVGTLARMHLKPLKSVRETALHRSLRGRG
jgi:Mn-containing catalase